MESTYKCPVCMCETVGVKNQSCGTVVTCPVCMKTGKVVYMEEQKKDFYCSMGNGLYSKKTLL